MTSKMTPTGKVRPPAVEQLHFRSQGAFLCALVNHRTKAMRVIDYRAGALPSKRLFIQNVAARTGVRKVFVLVEKEEASGWARVGFVREGTIPGFYRRSDGHLLGCVLGASVDAAGRAALGRLADKTVASAKRMAGRAATEDAAPICRDATAKQALEARDSAWEQGPQTGAFDGFGQEESREFVAVAPKRGGKLNYVAAQVEACFGHALIEVLRSPESPAEGLAVQRGIEHWVQTLIGRGVVSGFAFVPADDAELAASFMSAGFRKSGLLAEGRVGQRGTLLLSRKLADPDRQAAAS